MQLFIHFIVILRIAYKLYAVIFYTQQQENAIPSQKKTAAKATVCIDYSNVISR